jgi:transposase
MLPPAVKIFVCAVPTDLRRSFDGLAGEAEQVIGQSPLSGHLFVFWNRRRNRVKILFWDRTGFWIFYKRLEEGTCCWPAPPPGATSVELDAAELSLVLEGIDLTTARRRRRYRRLESSGVG